MNRRHLLGCCAALGAGLFTGLTTPARAMSFREGLSNPCRGALPAELAHHDMVLQAFEGVDARKLWDSHAHLLGTGDSGSGCTVNPRMHAWWHPSDVVRRKAILNAACVPGDAASVDAAYLQRLKMLAADFPTGARWLLFAFDHAHDDAGLRRADWTTFHVPNAYAAQVAAQHAERFACVASIHPYRDDALQRLNDALSQGAVAMKWLPSAMNIDMRHPRCRPFYERLASSGLPLIVHCGEEKAVPGAGRDELGNPLLARHPLAAGVRVVMAHCASLGHAHDIDLPSQPKRPAFDLWARLMGEPEWRTRLFGDISAVLQANRTPDVRRAIVQREEWHPRLLHGSDYPLPGVMPLYAPDTLAAEGLIDARDVGVLRQIRAHNPLLFDFVLKRRVRVANARLSPCIFETRGMFAA
jgi:mannonate dehydratase